MMKNSSIDQLKTKIDRKIIGIKEDQISKRTEQIRRLHEGKYALSAEERKFISAFGYKSLIQDNSGILGGYLASLSIIQASLLESLSNDHLK